MEDIRKNEIGAIHRSESGLFNRLSGFSVQSTTVGHSGPDPGFGQAVLEPADNRAVSCADVIQKVEFSARLKNCFDFLQSLFYVVHVAEDQSGDDRVIRIRLEGGQIFAGSL